MIDFVAVIPARYDSERLPGKPLADIAGKPMLYWVHRQALQSGAAEVIVATDDARIAKAAREFGARVELTRPDHARGTDRIAELAERSAWDDDTRAAASLCKACSSLPDGARCSCVATRGKSTTRFMRSRPRTHHLA
jgi:CMP-2-keto-3-deoxyoctulosonic acid synthetase